MMKKLFLVLLSFLLLPSYLNASICTSSSKSFNASLSEDIPNTFITKYIENDTYIVKNSNNYIYDGIGFTPNSSFLNGGYLNTSEFLIAGGKESYHIDVSSYLTSTFNTSEVDIINVTSENGYNKVNKSETCDYMRITEHVNPQAKVTGNGLYADPWIFNGLADFTPPEITFVPNTNTSYVKKLNVTVKVEDSQSKLIGGEKVNYLWTKDDACPTNSNLYTNYTSLSYSEDYKSASASVSSPYNANGQYYLCVNKGISDIANNAADIARSGVYHFDNKGPSCTLAYSIVSSSVQISLTDVVDDYSLVSDNYSYNYNYTEDKTVSSTTRQLFIPIVTPKTFTVSATVADSLGNTSSCSTSVTVTFDTLYNKILANPQKSDSSINFSTSSSISNTNGLYYTTNTSKTENGNRVYYFRGNVENNYVFFAGYCWRIVRTVEDGSIRLRFGGTPFKGICPSTGTNVSIGDKYYTKAGSSNATTGYMYGDINGQTYETVNANTYDSEIKRVIDEWYYQNILPKGTSVTSLIADTPYCNDRSVGTHGKIYIWKNNYVLNGNGFGYNSTKSNHTSGTIYAGARRLSTNGDSGTKHGGLNANPTYKCAQNNDKFTVSSSIGNGALTYPIALLTSDEIAFAGKVFGVENYNYFLNTGKFYWSMTPMCAGWKSNYIEQCFFNIGSLDFTQGENYSPRFDYHNEVLPAISLVHDTYVMYGDGSKTHPYIIYTPSK